MSSAGSHAQPEKAGVSIEEPVENVLWDHFSKDGQVQVDNFLSELKKSELEENDERLAKILDLFKEWKTTNSSSHISEQDFKTIMRQNSDIVGKAFLNQDDPHSDLPPEDEVSIDEGEPVEDVLWELFSREGERDNFVEIEVFLAELRRTGLKEDDPRLAKMYKAFEDWKKANKVDHITEYAFKTIMHENMTIVRKAFSSEFEIPDFETFCESLRLVYDEVSTIDGGQTFQEIPHLAKQDRNLWGVSVCTVDGQRMSFGDVNNVFPLQSCTKPFMYAVGATDVGPDYMHKFVGFEPSGLGFNAICLDSQKRPHNPMIAAGSIVNASLIKPECNPAERFEFLQEKYEKLCGGVGHVGFNQSVFLSQRSTAYRNYALAYFMKESNCFPEGSDIEEAMDLFFQACAIEVDCESLAVMAASLAKGGVCPVTDERILTGVTVKDTLSLMFSCGMYDYSGQFAFKVGLPAKSAVSGAVMLVIPKVAGIVCFAPPVDASRNSVKGVAFCQRFVEQFGYHNFNTGGVKTREISHQSMEYQNDVIHVLMAAQAGDLSAIRRYSLQGIDLNVKDYDSRTAIHIAAAEGNLGIVKFLVERGKANVNATDRWGNTAMSEATQFGRTEVVEYLKSRRDKYSKRWQSAIRVKNLGNLAE